ncbi:MAG: TonB-dependent receptor [Gammaproteobacteria bacterium]|nr:TonB-dependent receptor [Gammaproteobacteria bacterium]
MLRVFMLLLSFVVPVCYSLHAIAADSEPARLSLFLFESGAPQPGVELVIDASQTLISAEDGSILASLPAGNHHFILQRDAQQLHTFDLNLSEGELIQGIVTLYSDGRVARIDIESSLADNQDAEADTQTDAETDLPPGLLQGVITSAENGKPVVAARVLISGLSEEVMTDDHGQYRVEVPKGTYTVSVLVSGFNTLTREQVAIESEQATSLDVSLSPSGMELPEFVVLEPFITGTLASVLEEQKSASAIASVLGADQISRAGDSNAASALRRATGLTVVDGKFVYVRGLGERFSSTLLNGARIPSPDPTRRVIAMDLFPASIIDSVLVQKSFSPNMPGEFSGGVVEIRTRTIPDDFFARLSVSTSYTDTTTFEKGLRYKGGVWDFFGVDDQSRALPKSLRAAVRTGEKISAQNSVNPNGFPQVAIDQFGADLSNVWDIDRETIGPDGKAVFSIGDVFQAGEFSFGYTGSARWNQTWDRIDEERRNVSASGTEDNIRLNIQNDDVLETTTRQVQTNLFLSTELNYAELHRLFATGLFVRQTEDQARIRQGFDINFRENREVRRFVLRYEETEMFMQQYGGEHTFDFLNDLGVDWLYTISKAKRRAPNERRYRYDELQEDEFVFSGFADNNLITFADLTDHDETIRFDIDLPFQPVKPLKLNLKSGYYLRNKQRESSIRKYQFRRGATRPSEENDINNSSLEAVLSDDNINTGVFTLTEVTLNTDNYNAKQTLQAYYGQLDMELFEFVSLTGGVRVEDNDQIVETFDLFNPQVSRVGQLESVDLLPAVGITVKLSDKLQIRASYSETISRPDFRELSSAFYRDPLTDEFIQGNESLQQSEITNYDFRWEYYLSDTESISAAFFWKDIDSPIEKVGLAGAGAPRQLQNTESATVYGVEAEIFKNLDFIHPVFEHFYVSANYTWTESNTKLGPENLNVLTTNNRPLQGHSPWIVNFQLGYDNEDWGTVATLLFNTYGERISELGRNKAPDIIEQPFKQLDVVWRQDLFDGLSLTFKAKNLLDDTLQMKQGNVTTRQFKKNREFTLGLNLDF